MSLHSVYVLDGHVEFLNEMMDWWEHAGLGEIDYELDPTFHVKVMLSHKDEETEGSLPLTNLTMELSKAHCLPGILKMAMK